MRQSPVWLLILLAPTILVPVGTLVFFLFGNVLLWPESDSTLLNVLQYLLIQLFWIGPIISFFVSLFFIKICLAKTNYDIYIFLLCKH